MQFKVWLGCVTSLKIEYKKSAVNNLDLAKVNPVLSCQPRVTLT